MIESRLPYDIEKIKKELIDAEETRLRKQYPFEDAWRAPRNIADSMGCVGCAMYLLDDYARSLTAKTGDALLRLYKSLSLRAKGE